MQTLTVQDFADWRQTARRCLQAEIAPHELRLFDADGQTTLFADSPPPPSASAPPLHSVPRAFLQAAETVSYHREANRWNLLYEILWRLIHEEPQLLHLTTDDSVHRLTTMEKAVRRDCHKMKAFVRFRRVVRDRREHFIAWHRPDHCIVRRVAPFFARRFRAMNWTILTPSESVVWDQQDLHFGPGVARSEAPESDELETLWLSYYASIFNPARIKTRMMKSEMPVRHWPTLPETKIIDDLLRDAPQRVQRMVNQSEGYQQTAAELLSAAFDEPASLNLLRTLAADCQACDLYREATQTVFGEGPATAQIVLVGEQPGDAEDRAGQPFVGPAGQLLDACLKQAGIDRQQVYVTNVVKHFKHTRADGVGGKRRLHKKPNAREVRCCRPWLDAELEQLTDAKVVVCLGATAATTLLGPQFRLSQQRGQVTAAIGDRQVLATWHPSAILRMPEGGRQTERQQQLVADLQRAVQLVNRCPSE